jgi:hypothetical protein
MDPSVLLVVNRVLDVFDSALGRMQIIASGMSLKATHTHNQMLSHTIDKSCVGSNSNKIFVTFSAL